MHEPVEDLVQATKISAKAIGNPPGNKVPTRVTRQEVNRGERSQLDTTN